MGNTTRDNKKIIILAILVGVPLLFIFLTIANKPSELETVAIATFSPRAIQTTPGPSTSPLKEITYQTIKRSSLETGAGAIIISKDYLNTDDMAALGESLKQNYANEKTANVRVFTDAQAALLYDKVIAEKATKEEDALYVKNFVGWYKKNGNNGYHEFDTFVYGALGEHSSIKY